MDPRPIEADAAALRGLVQLLEHSADGFVQFDASGRVGYLNAAARAEIGYAPQASLDGLNLVQVMTSAAWRVVQRDALPALHQAGHWQGELMLRTGGTHVQPFSASVVAHPAGATGAGGYSAQLRNLSAKQLAHQQIQRQADVLQAITEAIPATVVVVDGEGRYRFCNAAFERQAGRPREQILGHRAAEVLGADEVARRRPFMARAYAGEAVSFTLDYPSAYGTTWLELSCIPLKVAGVVDGFVGITQDVTERRREQDRLTHLAERDPLTGLLNRAGFEAAVEQRLRTPEAGTPALLYIDLDRFKPVNDTHGHAAGDRVLQQFARRLAAAVRSRDVVARLGGDEFAVLLSGMRDEAHALSVADKILAAAREPIETEYATLRISASIGLAFGLRPQAGWREMLARADGQLYVAKGAGRDRAAG